MGTTRIPAAEITGFKKVSNNDVKNPQLPIDAAWLDSVTTVGVTSGASVPEELVAAVLDKLAGHGFGDVEEVEAVEEHMTFALPRELRAARPAGPAGHAGLAGPESRPPG